MDSDFFTEPLEIFQQKFGKYSQEFEAEADRRLERFTANALKSLGENLGAVSLTISVEDVPEERIVIAAKLIRIGDTWQFHKIGAELGSESTSILGRNRPRFFLRSQFLFNLNLPHQWLGMMVLEFSGIVFLSNADRARIQNWLDTFCTKLTIIMMELQISGLNSQLNQEKDATERLTGFTAELSKQLYCLSAISNALGQSHSLETVLTKVLETTLPILGARLGVIFFPATSQCVMLRSPRSRSAEDQPSFRNYFESMLKINEVPISCSFRTQSLIEHEYMPQDLKVRLGNEQVETILEFSLAYRGEFVGLGILGYAKNWDQSHGSRLLMTVLNMIGLFLQQIFLMGQLENQVKLVSQEKIEMEKKHRFLMDNVGQPFTSREKKPLLSEMLLDEMEKARNMALLAELASGVAHQIRNPLSNLLYGLHLIKNNGVPEDEKAGLVDSIIERVETMNRMINEFVQYTRLPELKFTEESVNVVLQNTLLSFTGWFKLSEAHVETDFDPNLPSTKLDIFLIDQVFHNVIKNSLEATDRKGQLRVLTRKLEITHGPIPHLVFAEIVFEDNGPGIASKDLENIMKPFFSTKGEGMGLGLALVDHIVRAHGGAVKLENRTTGGTCIRIYLPIR